MTPQHGAGADSSHLPLGVHLQDVHHVDHDVLVGLLVLPHPEGHGEPAGPTRAHVRLPAVLLPLAHLTGGTKGEKTTATLILRLV